MNPIANVQSKQEIENVVVVGSGPAGWSAAIYAARAALRPLLFEGALSPENFDAGVLPMGQLATTTEVENYPGFPVGSLGGYLRSALETERAETLPPETLDDADRAIYGAALVELMRKQAVDLGTRVVSEDVVSVDFSSSPLKFASSDGSTIFSKSAIIATGASARWLGLPSEERFKNNGVSACAVCDGALPRFYQRPIVVVGGGDVAVEDAEYLTKFASKVYLVHRRDSLRASVSSARRVLNNPKIEILWNRKVVEILGNDDAGVTGVLLANLADPSEKPLQLETSGVFVGIGRRANVGFLQGALELTDSGVIKRTIPFRTNSSVPGVFVAGDVADDRYRQAIVAAASGAQAALDAELYIQERSLQTV